MKIEDVIRQNVSGYRNRDFALPFSIENIQIPAKATISAIGRTENDMYFLKEGVVQVTTMRGNEERILEFVFPGRFFCAYTSFLLQEPSDVAVSAITACEVSRIKKKDLLEAAHESLVASHVCLYIAEQLFLSRARREKDLLTLSAEERYHALFEKSPEIIKFIPGNKIAKYLGIHPESLSRIKKNIIP